MRSAPAGMLVSLALGLAAAGCSPPPPEGVEPAVPGLPPPPRPDLAGVTLPAGFTATADRRIYCVRDGSEMVLVPAGEFVMGNDGLRIEAWWSPQEAPEHVVDLDAFLVDRCPVTVGQWLRFCRATGSPPSSPDRTAADDLLPVTDVPFARAEAYAAWAGKSLPTEAQWEKSSRGTDGRLLPWGAGEHRHPDRAMPVGSFPLEASPYGVLDLEGGPLEWCLDFYADYPPERYLVEPRGPPSGDARVLRNDFTQNTLTTPRGIYIHDLVELRLFDSVKAWRRTPSASVRNAAKEDAGNAFRCVRRLR
jgi:formylglycine-generating enzyme required for sulfatase activity